MNMTSCFWSLLLFMEHGRNQRAPFFTILRVEGPLPAGVVECHLKSSFEEKMKLPGNPDYKFFCQKSAED